MRRATCIAALALLTTACGDNTLTQGEINDATARVERVAASAHLVRGALEVLGLMPVYTCGEPRRSFLSHAVEGLTSIIEPVMIVFMAVMVGTIVIAMFLPMVEIIKQLSG